MTHYFRLSLVFLLAAVAPAFAAAPHTNDYARGIAIDAPPGRPLVEVTLPDAVYQTVTRADLGDMRVFNAEGVPVPHALCALPETAEPVISEQSLPIFELRERQMEPAAGSRIEVQTAGGTQVHVQEQNAASQAANGRTHIIDARGSEEPLRAIQFGWQSPDGTSEVKVSIQSSDDLDRWTVLVPASTLLLATRGKRELKRERIELPVQPYKYLRVQRIDGGPPLTIDSVIAERVAGPVQIEPYWFMATSAGSGKPGVLLFETARLAPIRYARIRLPRENSSTSVILQSRSDEKSSWQERWRGEAYQVVTDTQRRESPPARLAPTTDRHWRLEILQDPQVYQSTLLELGYRPARLRFLAQGPGPFTLAFGSRRAEAAPVIACDALLADVQPQERAKLSVAGYPGMLRVLGGENAFKPLPKETPLRLIVLWSVLIMGVALLVAMALVLLKRVKRDTEAG